MRHDTCDRNCQACLDKLCTHGIPIFASLDYAQLERLALRVSHRTYARGEVMFSEGEKPRFAAIFNAGSAKASRLSPDGREQILYVFSEGDFVGEQHLLFDRAAGYTVEALEEVRACLLYKDDFLALLRESPDIGIRIIEDLGTRLERLERVARHMGVRALEGRIGAALLEFADKYGTPSPEGTLVRLPFSREGLASYIGIARETVSRKLGQLESDGVIRSEGNRAILSLDRSAREEVSE
ncbi:MAG: Crp/Fnr family transcriptional regulator [Clostridiaceae bacterium]|nr:Crp/Fnr family transcriptional regulator [Clostridiaceae bacterium]